MFSYTCQDCEKIWNTESVVDECPSCESTNFSFVQIGNFSEPAIIKLKDLEMIGCDYDRFRDYYLDKKSGKLYRREVTLARYMGDVHIVNSILIEMGVGPEVLHTDNHGTMNKRN